MKLSINRVAEMLEVHRETVLKYIRGETTLTQEHPLPAKKRFGRWQIDVEEFEKWLEEVGAN